MSQVRAAAETTGLLQSEDYLLLRLMVRGLRDFDRVPTSYLAGLASMPSGRVEYHLSRLERAMLIKGSPNGYKLLSMGLDVLALHSYFEKKLLSKVGPAIAMGKESDVFEAMGVDERPLVLKLYRLGRISFRDIRRKRGYASPEDHEWLRANIRAAAREARALGSLSGRGLPVPKLIASEYHTLLMEMEMGIPLYKVKELDDAARVLKTILEALRRCYLEAKLVNGDVSEYNVLITPTHRIVIIDWPQAVSSSHPNALDYLRRDVQNVVRFFARRHGVDYPKERALRLVTGRAE